MYLFVGEDIKLDRSDGGRGRGHHRRGRSAVCRRSHLCRRGGRHAGGHRGLLPQPADARRSPAGHRDARRAPAQAEARGQGRERRRRRGRRRPQDDESTAADFTALEDYLASPSPFATLVFVATEIDRTRRFTKKLVEKAQVVTLRRDPDASRDPARQARAPAAGARKFVLDEMTREGRTMDPAALKVLVDRSGEDISKLRGDLERLLLYIGRPQGHRRGRRRKRSPPTARRCRTTGRSTNAIGAGDAARALARTGAAARSRRLASRASSGSCGGGCRTRLAESSPDRVKPALDALLRTDLALKSSGGDDRVLLERLVVELTGRPVGRDGPRAAATWSGAQTALN